MGVSVVSPVVAESVVVSVASDVVDEVVDVTAGSLSQRKKFCASL